MGNVYDESLYEIRLRQHTPNWIYNSIDALLMVADPRYAACSSSPRTTLYLCP